MASNNRYPVVGSANDDDSPIMQRAFAFGKAVADLVKEGERSAEARAHSRLTPRIDLQVSIIKDLESRFRASEEQNADLSKRLKASDDRLEATNKHVTNLEESLKAWKDRAIKSQAKAAQAKADADDRVARITADYQARTRRLMEFLQPSEQNENNAASFGTHVGNGSGGSVPVVNSSVNTDQQSNQPEQRLSPSSSDTTANARIKREDVETMQLLEWGSSSDSDRSDFASTFEMVDEIDMIESCRSSCVSMSQHSGEFHKRIRELKGEDEAINGSSQGCAKHQRTE
ncbi:hypothetical protein FACUT_10808 [Fusarium acutatum]|uniref:Uncharacterized protein n=1 Tax=Fusarium acutatum TaxID=78861 RepID=A0A8H4NBA4_9HYPO|nr:hypothetical protein FACUT_10808 [Fusarium acutatum]